MAQIPYIDETGIHIPEYQDILDELKAQWRSIFGDDLYLEADSQEGEMLQIFALARYDAALSATAVYQGFSPQTAQGMGLSRMVKVNGISRSGATRSYAPLRIVGVAGTEINGGIAEDVAGRKWNLPPKVLIPYEGEITVTATAQDFGAVRAQAGEINKIATPTRGWQTVNNLSATIAGAAIETDAELRLRQARSVAIPSLSVMEGIIGAVWNISGVTKVRGYENDTNTPDENGIPAHSISLVVDGGDIQKIAEAIRAKKTPGTGTYGSIISPVFDSYGLRTDIQFFRPAVVDAQIFIELKIKVGYGETISERIVNNLVSYVNSLGIGNPVLLSRLYAPISDADVTNEQGSVHFDVLQLLLSRGGAASAQNIPIAFNELAVLDPADVSIITTT